MKNRTRRIRQFLCGICPETFATQAARIKHWGDFLNETCKNIYGHYKSSVEGPSPMKVIPRQAAQQSTYDKLQSDDDSSCSLEKGSSEDDRTWDPEFELLAALSTDEGSAMLSNAKVNDIIRFMNKIKRKLILAGCKLELLQQVFPKFENVQDFNAYVNRLISEGKRDGSWNEEEVIITSEQVTYLQLKQSHWTHVSA